MSVSEPISDINNSAAHVAKFVAVEAVVGEPVSVRVFPVKWENTGNFRRSSLKNGTGLDFRTGKSEGCGQIPYASEQGIFRS
jgi:hypothetical protein